MLRCKPALLKERPPLSLIVGWQMRALGPATFKETFGMPYGTPGFALLAVTLHEY